MLVKNDKYPILVLAYNGKHYIIEQGVAINIPNLTEEEAKLYGLTIVKDTPATTTSSGPQGAPITVEAENADSETPEGTSGMPQGAPITVEAESADSKEPEESKGSMPQGAPITVEAESAPPSKPKRSSRSSRNKKR